MGRSRSDRNSKRSNRRTRPGSKGGVRRGGSKRVTITSMSPVGNISGSRPMVQATVKDSEATLSKSDISVYLDGEAVRGISYHRRNGNLRFTPRKLSSGSHTVEIEAGAAEGSRNARKSWSFVVK